MTSLLDLAAELVAIPSVSLNEAEIAGYVADHLGQAGWLEVVRVGDNVVARTNLGALARVLIAGHLDTVPAPASPAPQRSAGETLWGLGATDMKGGIAVMLDVAVALEKPRCDVTYLFYTAEEIARAHSGLLAVEASRPDLLAADAAIVCEPTSCAVEAGCQGVLRAELSMGGARAHVARPWMGDNALHRLGPLLCAVAQSEPRQVVIDGCTYRESVQAVRAWGGVAANVVPDSAGIELNYRFAPDRSTVEAEAALRAMTAGWMQERDTFEVVDGAPAAPPSLQHQALAMLVELSGRPPAAKLGWTDVAFFAERGIAAANFGPGDPELAHTPGEFVTLSDLERARNVLSSLLGGYGG